MPKLILLCGLPGAGKTYLAERLARRPGFVHVASDYIRQLLFPQPKFTLAEHSRVFDEAHKFVKMGLQNGDTVIMDATNLRERHRIPLRAVAAAFHAPIYEFFIDAPQAVREERIRKRGRGDVEGTIAAARKMEKYIDATAATWLLVGTEPVETLETLVMEVVESNDGSNSPVSA